MRRAAALLGGAGLVAALLAGTPGSGGAVPAQAVRTVSAEAAPPAARPAVVGKRVIGKSVRGRRIMAWHLGEPGAPRVKKVVLIATMHGNEPATRRILESLRDGAPIIGVDLWVIPTYNPDGLARGTRKNAHGVDLNRNFPYRWADLDGNYESGPKPRSEPETRAVMRFLRTVRPDRVLSFHQPLYAVDTDTKKPAFARRVARKLDLPRRALTCGGVCHGTMTGWFNRRFAGAALTVEYGAHPSLRTMSRVAPRQVLSVFGARRRVPIAVDPAPPSR
ncbi:M14 family zinc carboxypeptidase [Nocardioides sp. 503]|uniref:M14 family zinc carboxypeptidase n=1 Tax=Nocardioides sp. 503 TaxID=2508326 RepID=UPI00106F2F65|nr:M14 family zinc carboxypeptidase [Nocardioides sp. 503]